MSAPRSTTRRILIGGVTAAAIIGAGGTALAVTGTQTASPGSGTTAKADHGRAHGDRKLLRHLEHAVVTTGGKKGSVTHTLVRGTVTAVSSTSITVVAKDKFSQTFTVTKDTIVLVRAAKTGADKPAKPTTSSIASVAKGDSVFATGTGTSPVTAKRIIELPKK